MLVTLLSPYPGAPARPSTPEVLQARERAPTPCSSTVFTLDSRGVLGLKTPPWCHWKGLET
jgi:hypothetical protein